MSNSFIVENALRAQFQRCPRCGDRTPLEFELKWEGYAVPTWEPEEHISKTTLCDFFLDGKKAAEKKALCWQCGGWWTADDAPKHYRLNAKCCKVDLKWK